MQEKIVPLIDVTQTLGEMYRLAEQYQNDLAPFLGLNLVQFYNHVKNIPFRPDPYGNEYVQRPAATLHGLSKYADCDDKSICLMSYCMAKEIPARFVCISEEILKPLHHVYLEIRVNGKWYPVDPTYPENQILTEKPFWRKEAFEYADVNSTGG